jgi:hypothetical protein
MNDLIRLALYGSYQAIQPVEENKAEKIVADVGADLRERRRCDREISNLAVIYCRDERGCLWLYHGIQPQLASETAGGWSMATNTMWSANARALTTFINGEIIPAALQ